MTLSKILNIRENKNEMTEEFWGEGDWEGKGLVETLALLSIN